MLGNLGVHVIHNPIGTFSFVGTLPTSLAEKVEATKDDVAGGRAFLEDGRTLVWRFPVFTTRADAVEFAHSMGVPVVKSSTCCSCRAANKEGGY